jgi:hypothetical protein
LFSFPTSYPEAARSRREGPRRWRARSVAWCAAWSDRQAPASRSTAPKVNSCSRNGGATPASSCSSRAAAASSDSSTWTKPPGSAHLPKNGALPRWMSKSFSSCSSTPAATRPRPAGGLTPRGGRNRPCSCCGCRNRCRTCHCCCSGTCSCRQGRRRCSWRLGSSSFRSRHLRTQGRTLIPRRK